jgi:hypothetical protein
MNVQNLRDDHTGPVYRIAPQHASAYENPDCTTLIPFMHKASSYVCRKMSANHSALAG